VDWITFIVGGVRITQQEDEICSGLTSSKVFTTGSSYRFMTTSCIDNMMACRIWKYKIPLKIRVFL
jgi:hypothetical protein